MKNIFKSTRSSSRKISGEIVQGKDFANQDSISCIGTFLYLNPLYRLKILLLITLALTSGWVSAQDRIIKRNKEDIECKVKEIGTTEIKYIVKDFNPDLLFSISKDEVDRIIFSDGKIQRFETNAEPVQTIEKNSNDLFAIQKKNALKTDFLSLINNTFSLTYERCLKPGRSVEFSLGAVGLGLAEKNEQTSGILFRGGYKLARSPDFYLEGIRYAHILKGPYAKLEFDFASYRVTINEDPWTDREDYTLTKWAFLVVFGNQWVFNDAFLIDLYAGLGIGKNNREDNEWVYPYGFSTLGNEFPMASSFGLRFGFLFH